MKKPKKTWNPTKHHGLYRHISGTYYARVTIAGKATWRSLKTTVLSVAKSEHNDLKEEVEHKNEVSRETSLLEPMTGAEAILIRERKISENPNLKKSSRRYWGEIIVFLRQSWPQFAATELRKITIEDCEAWAGRIAKEISPTRYNNSLSMLKSLFDIAIKKGVRRNNPAANLKRMKIRQKDLSSRLPSRTKFSEWVKAIRQAGGRFSADCADFVEFLAYTGMRKGEAAWVKWKNCDFVRGEILVEGDPEEATKNSEVRRIPINSAARQLLERLKANREVDLDSSVLGVREAQKAMDRAAGEVGMAHITHHDLRHLFATICIESGVDIPTVSKWLGHKDGGALAMKVYGHLRNEHSLAAASRVSFAAP